MLNIKNIFIISFSAIFAAVIASAVFETLSVQSLSGFFACGIISGLVTLIIQSFTANLGKAAPKSNKPNKSKAKAKKAKAKKAPGSISSDHEEGTVKWFDSKKGYGFITRAMGEDIFVHFRSIQGNGYRSLQEGQAVKFVVTTGDKGPQAEDIHVI